MSAAQSGGGVVTFLFTDLVASTATAARLGAEAADELRRMHFALLRRAITAHHGEEVKNLGDGIMAAFASPLHAARAAIAIQTAAAEHNVASADRPLPVRIGLHAGEPVRENGDYFGTPVVIAARLCGAARGGQILASDLVAALVGTRGGLSFHPQGALELKGLHDPVPAAELAWGAARPPRPAPAREPTRPPRRRAPRGPELVGRTDEMALLEAEHAVAATGQMRCVLLTADPGVGKTRLAGELLRRHGEDATVLQARAHSMSAPVAFGLWVEALDPLLQVLSDDEVAHMCGGFLDDLSGLFHRVAALRGPWSAAPTGLEPPRPRLLAGLVRMLDELCARGRLVVLLDDVHWADASSWDVLRQVARRLAGAPLQIVLTARPAELTQHESAAPVLFELEQDGFLTRMELMPLREQGLRALAEQIVGAEPQPALVAWLAARSRGNALFAIGLLRALLDEGADLAAPALRRLPEGLAERIAVRARSVPAEQRAVLELLTVAGRPLPLADLVRLAGSTLEELSPLLEELVAGRGIVETERGRSLTYEMAHPLIRDAAYEQIGGARRRVLHRHMGRVLREAGRIAEAAGHYARCAEPGDPEAVAVLVDALREAEQREAVTEALTVLAALVDLLPAGDRRWLDVLDAMHANADWIPDHRADTHAAVAVAALRAIDGHLTETDDPTRRAVVKFRLGYFLGWCLGDVRGAREQLAAARDLFAAGGDPHRVRVAEREHALVDGIAGEFTAMFRSLQGMARSAEAAGDVQAAMLAWSAAAGYAAITGRFDEAAAANERTGALAGTAGKPHRTRSARGIAALLAAFDGQITLARQMLADSAGHDAGNLDAAAIVEWNGGDFPAALAAARESALAAPGPRTRRLQGMLAGACAAVELADPVEARRHLDRANAVLDGRDWQFFLPGVRMAEALLAWSSGDAAAAMPRLRAAADRLHEMDVVLTAIRALYDLAELAATIGEAAVASDAAARMAPMASRTGRDPYLAMAAAAAGWAMLAAGDHGGAVATARTAVGYADSTECAALHARTRHVLGRALMDVAPAEAAATLEDAARRYAECGAVWRRGMVLELMRRQGNVARRALAAALGPDSLTRRERDVAQLAARGLSVKEIAAQLFVGERTVETHLGNLYAKLGVDSKLELVHRAAELGLT